MVSEDQFDPVAEMKKLLEAELAEGEAFKQNLRDEGVDVEQWEAELESQLVEDLDLSGHIEL